MEEEKKEGKYSRCWKQIHDELVGSEITKNIFPFYEKVKSGEITGSEFWDKYEELVIKYKQK